MPLQVLAEKLKQLEAKRAAAERRLHGRVARGRHGGQRTHSLLLTEALDPALTTPL